MKGAQNTGDAAGLSGFVVWTYDSVVADSGHGSSDSHSLLSRCAVLFKDVGRVQENQEELEALVRQPGLDELQTSLDVTTCKLNPSI